MVRIMKWRRGSTVKDGKNHVAAFPLERESIQQASQCRDNQRSVNRDSIRPPLMLRKKSYLKKIKRLKIVGKLKH